MELGLLVLCSEERAAEAASLLPEQGWELIHLAEDKPAPCTGLGSSRSFSSSCLEIKDLFKVRTECSVTCREIPSLPGPVCTFCLSWAMPSTDMLEEAPTGLVVLFSLLAL